MTLTALDKNLQDSSDQGEVLVRVDHVSKKFCRSLKKALWYGIQDIGLEMVGRKYDYQLRADEFWAVNDISFEESNFFSPSTVEHLQQMILDSEEPDHFIKAPVYNFTSH